MPKFVFNSEEEARVMHENSITPNEVTYSMDANTGEEFIILTFKDKNQKPVKASLDVIMELVRIVNHELLGSNGHYYHFEHKKDS